MRMKWEYTLSDSSDQEEDQIALPAALAGSGQLDRLVETARSDARQALSENTLRAYAKDWSHFARWCRMRGADPVPQSPEVIGLCIADLAAPQGKATVGCPSWPQYAHPGVWSWHHRSSDARKRSFMCSL